MINRLAIIGVGLIGGSLSRSLHQHAYVREVVGCGRGKANLEAAVKLGVIDNYTHDPAEAVAEADIVVVATNLRTIPDIFQAIAPALSETALITDVGSAKSRVIEAAEQHLGEAFARFVPGHPIAGTERSGVEASFAELYIDHRVILTPTTANRKQDIDTISAMWTKTGAIVNLMDAVLHDEVLAATSHLPHMVAFALVDCLASMEASTEIFDFAAGGFRDFTRIASSNPPMWRDIALENRAALLRQLEAFEETLAALKSSLQNEDEESMLALFERAKSARDAIDPNQ
ncbi:MAG: prephenate dehydrogenase/arogenate dehydrogenase family protein [Pseudomonadota bacterium]